MKKYILTAALCIASLSAFAQMNFTVQTACHPDDVKNYDTERLRSAFLMEKVMSPDEKIMGGENHERKTFKKKRMEILFT